MSKKSQLENQATVAVANMVGQIGCLVSIASFAIIGCFFGVGYLLDIQLGTSPYIMLASIILSFPFTLYAIVRLSLSALERANRVQQKAQAAVEALKLAEEEAEQAELEKQRRQDG